jgi:hypothetical protein
MTNAQAGRVIRVSTDEGNGGAPLHELFAVAVDDDQGALDAFHQQYKVYDDGIEIVGPLRQGTIALLTLANGQASPL